MSMRSLTSSTVLIEGDPDQEARQVRLPSRPHPNPSPCLVLPRFPKKIAGRGDGFSGRRESGAPPAPEDSLLLSARQLLGGTRFPRRGGKGVRRKERSWSLL